MNRAAYAWGVKQERPARAVGAHLAAANDPRNLVTTSTGIAIGCAYEPPVAPAPASACCTGDCRQGRDCPERTPLTPFDLLDAALLWAGRVVLAAFLLSVSVLALIGVGAVGRFWGLW